MKITRDDIDRKLSGGTAIAPDQSANITKAIFEAIADALCAGDTVSLHGFGRFSLRPKRASGGRAVAFRGFKRLCDRIDANTDKLAGAAWAAPQSERRREPREGAAQDGTAIVRISGIPVCEFKLKSISENGTSFWVREDSFVLRNLLIGQEIEIRMHNGHCAGATAPALFRARIVHIVKDVTPEMSGYFVLGVQILVKLPM